MVRILTILRRCEALLDKDKDAEERGIINLDTDEEGGGHDQV